MPTKKKITGDKNKVTVIETKEVALRTLKVYYKNPRVGNVDKIAKSLHLNGQYRPLVVNIGTHTGRKNEILAGNHTYLGARKPLFFKSAGTNYDKPAWDRILVSFVDVDEDAAAQIVIADNKTAEDGTYDEAVLNDLISGLPDIVVAATGYEDDEFEDLITKFEEAASEEDDIDIDALADEYEDEEEAVAKPPKFDDTDLGDEDEATDDAPTVKDRAASKDEEEEDDPEGAGIEITKVDEEIKGAYELKDAAYYDGVGYFNIPKLRKDQLVQVEDLPDTLTTWAGSATKYDDDPDTWWLYNYAIDSTSGMKDVSKVFVSFYTYDEYFESWWYAPSKYVGKVINSGIKYILTPDFSDDINHGRGFSIWQLFRARWLGRYFQEAGLKLLPNISWPDGDIDFLKKYTLATLPKGIPVIAMQMQTFDKNLDEEHLKSIAAEFQLVMDTIEPKVLVLYSGQPGYDFFMENVETEAEVRFLLNRQAKLSVARKGRKKKNTL